MQAWLSSCWSLLFEQIVIARSSSAGISFLFWRFKEILADVLTSESRFYINLSQKGFPKNVINTSIPMKIFKNSTANYKKDPEKFAAHMQLSSIEDVALAFEKQKSLSAIACYAAIQTCNFLFHQKDSTCYIQNKDIPTTNQIMVGYQFVYHFYCQYVGRTILRLHKNKLNNTLQSLFELKSCHLKFLHKRFCKNKKSA